MNSQSFTATYLIETPVDPAKVAEVMAGEQSCGTFTRVQGETDELRARARARIEAVARRTQGTEPAAEILELAPFKIDRAARSVERDGRRIELTDKEYALAEFLFQRAGNVVSREHLREAVWGLQAKAQTRTVDTHMSRLRTKLGLGGEHGWRLASVHQFGYRLERADQ